MIEEGWKEEARFSAKTSISQPKLFALDPDKARDRILESLVSMACNIAPSLFEVDPRIGRGLDESFPRSPLLDPPGDLHLKLPLLAKKMKSEPQHLPEARSRFFCPLCSRPLFPHDAHDFLKEMKEVSVIWGGGNLGWVHACCAPWVSEKPADL